MIISIFVCVSLVTPSYVKAAVIPVPGDNQILTLYDYYPQVFNPYTHPNWTPINTSIPYGDVVCPTSKWGLISTENDNNPYPDESDDILQYNTGDGDINPEDYNDNKLVFAATNDFTDEYIEGNPPSEDVNIS